LFLALGFGLARRFLGLLLLLLLRRGDAARVQFVGQPITRRRQRRLELVPIGLGGRQLAAHAAQLERRRHAVFEHARRTLDPRALGAARGEGAVGEAAGAAPAERLPERRELGGELRLLALRVGHEARVVGPPWRPPPAPAECPPHAVAGAGEQEQREERHA